MCYDTLGVRASTWGRILAVVNTFKPVYIIRLVSRYYSVHLEYKYSKSVHFGRKYWCFLNILESIYSVTDYIGMILQCSSIPKV